MSRKLLLLSCLGCLFCSPLIAETMVVFPAGDFSCAVDVTPHTVPKPDPTHPERRYVPALRKVGITQIGNIRRDVDLWSDNSVSQIWSLISQGVSLWESNAAGKDVYVLRGELRDGVCPKLLHFDADSVSWMTDRALSKQSDEAGGPLHYAARVVLSTKPRVTAIYQAWIDPKTLLPLRFDDGSALYVLTFSPTPPAGPLVMPDKIEAELKRWQVANGPHPHL